MARKARFVVPGCPLHVIQRGNNRQATFFHDTDYHFYLQCLCEASERYGCRVHAFVLMTNHVHLLITPDHEQGVSRMMQAVGRRYVQYINRTYQRSGTLWEGRYKAALIQGERYLLTCFRYIELNPVRAGMVVHPGDYQWSSFRVHTEGEENRLIRDHALYMALAKTDKGRQAAYKALFESHIDPRVLSAIRETTHNGWVLGNERFKDEIEANLQRRVRPSPRGGDRRSSQYRAKHAID